MARLDRQACRGILGRVASEKQVLLLFDVQKQWKTHVFLAQTSTPSSEQRRGHS